MRAAAMSSGNPSPFAWRSDLRRLPFLRFTLHAAGDAQRGAVEDYIRGRFAGRHGAHVEHFLPQLLALGRSDEHCAAVGLASASQGRLFAETYLDAPVESMIEARVGAPVARGEILEIGNLVSTWKGGSLLLFVFLSELIDRIGSRWVVFTVTREVESLLARLGYAPVALAAADPARLADGGRSWGSYYRNHPRVMFGDVPPAVAAARRDLRYRLVARVLAPQVERLHAQFRERGAVSR